MPADVRIIRYDGEYGPNLKGFLKSANPTASTPPRVLDHHFHVRNEFQSAVAPYWDFTPRPKYRLLELPLSVVNVGDEVMDLGNVFTAPQYYVPLTIGAARWMKVIRGVFSYSFDGEAPKPLRVILLWDSVPAAPGFPKAFSGFFDVKLSPAWGAPVAEEMFAPVDITDVPDGDHLFSVMVEPPDAAPHTVSFAFNLNVTDLRLIPS